MGDNKNFNLFDIRPHAEYIESMSSNSSHSSVKIVKRRVLQKRILKVTDGILGTLSNFVLLELFFLSEYASSFNRRAVDKSLRAAHRDIYDVNYQSIKNTLHNLKRKGLIKSLTLGIYEEIITEKGRKRLKEQVPIYQKSRPWDKRIYLVTYDIPEEKKGRRNVLRDFLKKINCAFLQGSVWLSVYNPKTLIKKFVKENNIPGQILVSDLGSDGSIGEENLRDLIAEVYHLEEINEEYEDFFYKFRNYAKLKKKEIRKAIFTFLVILNKDPQLPFSLLPENWKGDEAYLLYQEILGTFYKKRKKQV